MPAATEQSVPDVTQIRELETRLDNFRIDTSPDLTIIGSAWEGYAFNCYTCDEIPESQGGGTTGACCIGTECSILTSNQCAEAGGIYQGDGTPCDPNPCGSPPVPCSSCCLGFGNPPFMDDDGNCWLISNGCDGSFSEPVPCDTFWRVFTLNCICDCPSGGCAGSCGAITTCFSTFDLITCETSENCSGRLDCGNCPAESVLSEQCFPCGACCIDGVCSITTEPDCDGSGGIWQGNDTGCVPNPC